MHRRGFLLATGMAAATLLPGPPAMAKLVRKFAEELKNGEYSWFPERSPTGPIVIVVSLPEQRVHVYRNGIRIAASTCSTGKKGHETPTGVFTILQKDKDHHSSTYDDAAMPNMNRLTWDGIALHAGNLPGYPASHGCVRLPMDFSERLFEVTQLGMTVILADDATFPPEIAHPGLVLDDSALGRYKAAETSVLAREYQKVRDLPDRTTGVVVSGADRTIAVLENGKTVAKGEISFNDRPKPLGERLFTLAGSDFADARLRWLQTDLTNRRKASTSPALPAFRAEPRVLAALQSRIHLGMSVLVTDSPAGKTSRSKPGFTVIST